MTEPHKIWIEQCEAAEQIEGEFELQKALDYLIGEKFLNFLEAAKPTPISERRSLPSSPRSRRSSSGGSWLNIWKLHGKQSRSILLFSRTTTRLILKRLKR